MDPTATDQTDLDYLLGSVGASSGLAVPSSLGVATGAPGGLTLPPDQSGAAGNGTTTNHNHNHHNPDASTSGASAGLVSNTGGGQNDMGDDGVGAPATSASGVMSGDDNGGEASANDTPHTPDVGGGAPANPKKRPLEDKKARDRKRILRNRQLARVSNERRKGRIKAMENELTETRQTVNTLEESIRCLEEENRELRNLLQGKSDAGSSGAVQPAAPPSVPPPVPPSV